MKGKLHMKKMPADCLNDLDFNLLYIYLPFISGMFHKH